MGNVFVKVNLGTWIEWGKFGEEEWGKEGGRGNLGKRNGDGVGEIWGTAFPDTGRLCRSGAVLWLILNMVVGIIIDGEEDDV